MRTLFDLAPLTVDKPCENCVSAAKDFPDRRINAGTQRVTNTAGSWWLCVECAPNFEWLAQ